jgi:N-acetylglucosaminyldiphosphoundecaprenol N-acetyl-beta-D-mannosaminyltransferase
LSRQRLRVGHLWIDEVTFQGALDAVAALVRAKKGGRVFTPNVDHVVLAQEHEVFREAYARADLSLVDGMPLVWVSGLLGLKLPEKISGSDLIYPLLEQAGKLKHRVYLLGGAEGVAEKAAAIAREKYGVVVVGTDSPRISADGGGEGLALALERIVKAKPDLLLVALGSPKGELLIHRIADDIRPTVAVGVGASLDFVAGTVKRAPRWVSKSGLEWLYRLTKEPKRLWRRYLVNDPKFLGILVASLRVPRSERVRSAP